MSTTTHITQLSKDYALPGISLYLSGFMEHAVTRPFAIFARLYVARVIIHLFCTSLVTGMSTSNHSEVTSSCRKGFFLHQIGNSGSKITYKASFNCEYIHLHCSSLQPIVLPWQRMSGDAPVCCLAITIIRFPFISIGGTSTV